VPLRIQAEAAEHPEPGQVARDKRKEPKPPATWLTTTSQCASSCTLHG